MQIAMVPDERKRSVFLILVDEEEWREVHADIFGKVPQIPYARTIEELKEAVDRIELQGVKKYVLNKLARRSYPSAELEHLLMERLVSKDTITAIIEECRQHGYINDEEWTERFVASQMRKGQGPRAIQQKLRAKGVTTIQALSDDQASQIQHLLQTRYRSKDLNNPKERQKVIASLMRRGFDYEAIQGAMKICFSAHRTNEYLREK